MNVQERDLVAYGALIIALLVVTVAAFTSIGGIPVVSDNTCALTDENRPAAFWCWVHGWQTLIAGVLAILGALLTIRHMRKAMRLAEMQRIFTAVGHAQSLKADLELAKNIYAKLMNDIRLRKAPVVRRQTRLVDWDIANIPVDIHPMVHNVVGKLIRALRHDADLLKHTGGPIHFTARDLGDLYNVLIEIVRICDLLDYEIIEPIVADLRKAGLKIWKDPNGFYRWDRSVKPRL